MQTLDLSSDCRPFTTATFPANLFLLFNNLGPPDYSGLGLAKPLL